MCVLVYTMHVLGVVCMLSVGVLVKHIFTREVKTV